MNWNDRLRRLVDEKGLSKAELSRRSGVPYDSVNKYLRGDVDSLTVRGNSLDKIAPAGTVLVCVDLASTGVDFKDGDLVIVERARAQNGLLEMTAKRVRAVAGGFELYPESSDPKWKPVMLPRGANDADEQVRVLARVDYILNRP